MKINMFRKKILLPMLALILLVAIGFIFYKFSPTQTEKNVRVEQEANDAAKKDFIEKTDRNGNSPTPSPTTDSSSTPITITAKNEADGKVTILTNAGALASGTCKLDIKNGSSSLTKSAPLIYQSEYSSCAGFTINTVEKTQLGSGNWEVALSVISNDKVYNAKTTHKVN